MTMPYKARQATPVAPGLEEAESGRTVAMEAQDASQVAKRANGEHADSAVRGELVSVFVHGTPRPKGNLKRSRSGHTYFEAHVVAWCDTVALACKAAYRTMRGPTAAPHSGPVAVELAFSFERPASHGAASRRGVRVGQAARTLPPCTSHRLGDLDKLSRNVLDSLTNGGVIVDDSHVVRLTAAKEYGGSAGVMVRVVAL